MENKTNYTGREIIVSKFEIYPFEPSECEYSGFPKGVCQLEINTRDKEVTLKVISGSAPSLQLAALVIRSNKHCLKMFANSADNEEFEKYYIMDSYTRSGFYSATFLAHDGTEGLPVIDKKIVSYNAPFGVFDFKLTALEYNLLIEHFNIHPLRSRKQIQYSLKKEYGFRYIK